VVFVIVAVGKNVKTIFALFFGAKYCKVGIFDKGFPNITVFVEEAATDS